jgi:sec-independent protein translocase protein TatA
MLGISTPELIAVLIIAMIVLGPRRLPEVARSIGKGLRELKKAMYTMSDLVDNPNQPEDTEPVVEEKPPVAEPPRQLAHPVADDTSSPVKPESQPETRSQP